jgi:protein TonB
VREGVRWAGSLALVLAVHAGAIGLALAWSQPEAPSGLPPAAVTLDLAPLPAAPATTPAETPPAGKPSEAVPDSQEPPPVDLKPTKIQVETAEPPPPVEVPLAEVVLPPPEPPPPVALKPPGKPKPPEKAKPAPPKPRSVAAVPEAAPPHAPQAVAPAPNVASALPSAGLPNWKGALLRHLERHKRYPQDAQRTQREGLTTVRFTMSRDGRVLASRTERTSGVASLDQEGLDLLQRAQPLPPLPSDQPGESLELVVPILFQLAR